jgi:VCBS repeat protein
MVPRLRTNWAALAPVGLAAVLVAGAARAADPSFAPRDSGVVHATATRIVDANGDGMPDLAVAEAESNRVDISLGDGRGGFRTAAPFQVGERPVAMATADFNVDGAADLAVANEGSQNLTILLGDGNGGFAPALGSPIAVGGNPGRVHAADLNGDGHADLAVPVYAAKKWQVSILLGDGSGRFAAAAPVARLAPHGYDLVAVADFNRDGKPDLAVGNTESKGISILLGAGNGAFAAATTVAKGRYGGAPAVADLNGDGKPDLVYASLYSAGVTVLLGSGNGAFFPAPGSPLVLPGHSYDVALADFNGDGKADLAVASEDRGTVSLLIGTGTGRFRVAAFSPFAASRSLDVAPAIAGVADFNGDGGLDLLTVSSGRLTTMLQTPAKPAVVTARAVPGRDAVFSTPGRVMLLAVDGKRAAVTTSVKHGCGRIVVWTAPGHRSTRVKPGLLGCDGDGVFELAIGGGRVAWVEEGGGNNLEMMVMAAKLGGGAARQIEYEANGDRAGGDPTGGWVGHLQGGGSLLAYNSWTQVCDRAADYVCGENDPFLRVTSEQLVRITAGRRVVVMRGAAAYSLAAVGGGRMAVGTTSGVTVRAASGAPLSTVPDPAGTMRGVALSATKLAIEQTFTLDLYEPATGAAVKSLPLGPAAGLQLADVTSRRALLRGPRRLVLVRLSDGKLISFPLGSQAAARLVGARLTAAGLFYAYNARGATSPGRIVFEPTARLLRRF